MSWTGTIQNVDPQIRPPSGLPFGPHSREERIENSPWFSLLSHQILKSKSQGLLTFYLKEVEDDLEESVFFEFPVQ